MTDIIEKNLKRYRDYLGSDRFALWIKEKLLEGKKGDLPFSFGTRYEFEDILKGIYDRLDDKERADMRWELSQASKAWDIETHGFHVLRRFYEWGLIIECKGVFSETLTKIERWKPLPQDYVNILEFGKIADELWSAKVRFKDVAFEETPFAKIAVHFRDMIIQDEACHFKVIYSPLFRLGCFANLDDWAKLASLIALRYPYNKYKDPWPEKFAIKKNCLDQKGFFDLRATLLGFASYVSLDVLNQGCAKMLNKYSNKGGFECYKECENAKITKSMEIEKNMGSVTCVPLDSPIFDICMEKNIKAVCLSDCIHPLKKIDEDEIRIDKPELIPNIPSWISKGSKTAALNGIEKVIRCGE